MSDTKPIEPIAPPIPTIKPPVPIQPPAADGGISGIDGAVPAPGKSLRNKEAKPYFLAPDNATDRMRSRPAAREIVAATPLIDGVAIFTELENLIDGAKSTVLLAYWALALDTKMVTDSDRTWGDMLIDAAGRGVKVRLLQTDFDPGIKTGDHTGAWYGRSQLLIAASKANLSSDVLQVVVSHHPAEVPATLMAVAMTDLYDNLAAQINADKNADQRTRRYLYSPGFWDKIAMDKTGTASPVKAHASYPAWPASHHQKIAIIDGRFALTGGANITPAYIDSSKHDKAVDQAGIGPWHDAYVKVEGAEIIRDFVSNYIGLWNQCRAAMDAFLKVQLAALKSQPVPPYVSIFKPVDLKESDIPIDTSAPKTTLPAIPAQMRRTVSVSNSAGPFFTTVRKDVLEGYALAISLADELVYIENQYFREELIGKAIIDRHKKNSKLKAIIVIPLRSEELVRKTGDKITQYGEALQYKIIDDMQRQMRSNLGVFAMGRGDGALVYVHSKLLIVDDKFASIGSANANPRSMFMDTELDVVWYDTASVSKLRRALWNEMLGKPSDLGTWKPRDYVQKWKAIADANKTATPNKLKGFVRPFVNVKSETGFPDLGAYS